MGNFGHDHLFGIEKFRDWDSQSVAIVGNATSLLSAEHGDEIDSFDVVLRMNRGLPKNPEAQGGRTDIVAVSVFGEIEKVYRQFGASHFIWMSPKQRDNSRVLKPRNLSYYPLERWQRLQEKLGARPSVGAMVLDLYSFLGPKKLSIFGFDFKRSSSAYLAKPHVGPHCYEAEERFCLGLVDKLGWKLHSDYVH